jgi:hypothetical protein
MISVGGDAGADVDFADEHGYVDVDANVDANADAVAAAEAVSVSVAVTEPDVGTLNYRLNLKEEHLMNLQVEPVAAHRCVATVEKLPHPPCILV